MFSMKSVSHTFPSEVSLKDKITYLSNLNLLHGACIDIKEINSLKKTIKELLENSSTRCAGLLLFESALKQKTPFYEASWMNIVKANLKVLNDTFCLEVTYRILKLILQPSSKCTAHIATVKAHSSTLIQLLIESNKTNSVTAIQNISSCLTYNDGLSIDEKVKVELHIIEQLDTNSPQICEASSDCLVNFLHSLSTARNDRKDRKPILFYYKKILYTLQYILNELTTTDEVEWIDEQDEHDFKDNDNIFSMPVDKEKSENKGDKKSPISSIMMLGRMFSSLCVCAAKLICSESQIKQELEVPILWILKFLKRVLIICNNIIKGSTSHGILPDMYNFHYLIHPLLHKGSFTILESLIRNFDLYEQVENIVTLIRMAIESSNETRERNSHIRCLSWTFLNLWISKNGASVASHVGNSEFVIQNLLKDTYPKDKDQIATNFEEKKGSEVYEFNQPDKTENNQIIADTYIEALKVLRSLVYTASPYLEETSKEQITSILSTAKKVQQNYYSEENFPFPYGNEKCRKALYELCLAVLLSSTFHIRITAQCLAVIKAAEKDESIKIKEFCQLATPLYRLLLHPKKKFPEVVRNSNVVFAPVDENAYSETTGWPNSTVNTARGNRPLHIMNVRRDNRAHISPETRKTACENEMPNYMAENEYNEYNPSNYDASYENNKMQCNGDESEIHISDESESESEEGMMDNETAEEETASESSPSKPFITTIHSSAIDRKDEIMTDQDVDSEEENLSGADEELDYSQIEEEIDEIEYSQAIEEEPIKPSKLDTAVVRTDQNGIASMSEEEILSSSKDENGEYSSDEEGSYDEEGEDYNEESKQEIEESEENEPPMKKSKVSDRIDAVIADRKTEIEDVSSEVEDIRTEVEDMRSEVGDVTTKVEVTTAEVGDMRTEDEEVRPEVGDIKHEVEDMNREVEDMKDEVNGIQMESENRKAEVEDMKIGVEDMKIEINSNVNEQKMQKESEDSEEEKSFEEMCKDFVLPACATLADS